MGPATTDSPACYVIRAFGGCRQLAVVLGIQRQAVWRWTQERGARSIGTGGRIPPQHHRRILIVARERGLDVTAQDLIEGRAST